MKAWTEWETARRQVAIGGRVVDEADQPVAGVEVAITVMPEAFQRRVAGAAEAAGGARDSDRALDLRRTTADGIYYFMDLPAGKYTVKGVERRSGAEAEKTVSVSRNKDGKLAMAVADLKLAKGRSGK
jgi:hypothetical protein